ncbi:MAG: hypothetical protein AB1763_02365 [Campylobacterota bacterium]
MYYVIQRHHGNPKKHYIAYTVPKYISSNTSQNVIFEFRQDGAVKRKWAPKSDIVLLTDDRALFESILTKLENLKKNHLERIDEAEMQLNREISEMLSAMQFEFDNIKESN